MNMHLSPKEIKEKLIVKAVKNTRRMDQQEETSEESNG